MGPRHLADSLREQTSTVNDAISEHNKQCKVMDEGPPLLSTASSSPNRMLDIWYDTRTNLRQQTNDSNNHLVYGSLRRKSLHLDHPSSQRSQRLRDHNLSSIPHSRDFHDHALQVPPSAGRYDSTAYGTLLGRTCDTPSSASRRQDHFASSSQCEKRDPTIQGQYAGLVAAHCAARDWVIVYLGMIASLAREVHDIFLAVLDLNPQLYTLWMTLCTRIIPALSLLRDTNNAFRLIDAFGQERRLDFATFRHFPVFISYLAEEYKNTPSGQYIIHGRYRLLKQDATELAVITKDLWLDLVRPGTNITLSIILRKLTAREGDICPGCGVRRNWSWKSHRHACSCGLTLTYFSSSNQNPETCKRGHFKEHDLTRVRDCSESQQEINASKTELVRMVKHYPHDSLHPTSKPFQELVPYTHSRQTQKHQDRTQEPVDQHTAILDSERQDIAVLKSILLEGPQHSEGTSPPA